MVEDNPFQQNYFELFGLPVSFDIDTDALKRHYRELQLTAHPDRYASQPSQQKRLAAQLTSLINEGFAVLRDPVRRARYVLELRGLDWSEEKHTISDAAFLMEQMELREQMDDIASRGGDAAAEAIAEFVDDVGRRAQRLIDELKVMLGHSREVDLEQARTHVQKLQFLTRLREEAERVEEGLS